MDARAHLEMCLPDARTHKLVPSGTSEHGSGPRQATEGRRDGRRSTGGSCGAEPSRMVRLALLAALPTGRSLLGLRPTLCGRGAASAAPRAFSAPARGAWRVRDPRRALLTHSLLAKAFVLLVVLDAGAVILCWHFNFFWFAGPLSPN